MRATWHAIRSELLRSIDLLSFQRRFLVLARSSEHLSGFHDPAALLDRLHATEGDPEEKNGILRALVTVAQNGSESATTLLLLALWPGLDAIYRRLSRHYRAEPEALVSALLERFLHGVRTVDLVRVNRIAATLLMNAERDLKRALFKTWSEQAHTETQPSEGMANPTSAPSRFGLPAGLDADWASDLILQRLHGTLGNDADLVVAVAVQGDSQREAAVRMGLTHEAARKRYRRALRRLRTALS